METADDRLRQALEMWEDGVCIMRENLRRRLPPSEIEAALDAWLTERPGAEAGDGEGVIIGWPRPRR
jgi:hypothetical protein